MDALNLSGNWMAIQSRIKKACDKSGRKSSEITVLAVTKTVPVSQIQEAYKLGIRHFGENKAQELLSKVDDLPKDIQWHFIGHLQSNKVKSIFERTSLIQSIDSLKLALDLNKAAARLKATKDILLEVNTSGESTKFGLKPGEALEVAGEIIQQCPNLKIQGLMTIGPNTKDEVRVREAFGILRKLRQECKKLYPKVSWNILSMGMTQDFEVAIEEGSTMIRIGTALFGARKVST